MDLLLAPETRPFAIAGVVLIALVGIEIAALMVGHSASHFLEKMLHSDDHGAFGTALDWLNPGRVPLIVLILLWLGAFAATGYVAQAVASVIWAPMPVLPAVALAVLAALPLARLVTGGLARILPRDETYAVDPADFVGKTAQVTVGPLDAGLPGRVRLQDAHGNWHQLAARAASGHGPMPVGSTVLLVDRKGRAFLAVPADAELLAGR
jgi:hypothetical protein